MADVKKRILGVGSACGDDCAGWLIVRALRAQRKEAPASDWECCELDRPGLALLNWLEGAAEVIIVDAMLSGAPLGQWRELALADLGSLYQPSSTHALGVAQALQVANALSALPPRLRVFGVEVADCAIFETGPSPALLAAIPNAVRRLTEALNRGQAFP